MAKSGVNRSRGRSAVCLAATGLALLCLVSCGSEETVMSTPPTYAVLSAFPAELAALLARASIDDTVEVDGRAFRRGSLGGARVVLGLTGIGLLNAGRTTAAVLDHLAVDGVIVSAVAGSFLRIGDVAVPESWSLADGTTYAADPAWLDLAREVAAGGAASLARCTMVPASGAEVCVAHEPAIFVGGAGRSTDSFGDRPFQCQPGGGEVFGCDVDEAALAAAVAAMTAEPAGTAFAAAAAEVEALAAEDMESAAVAREAAARGIPFIAFRGVSDGADDPLNLPGFPAQFFTYYRLAANNAAAATTAFLQEAARRGGR